MLIQFFSMRKQVWGLWALLCAVPCWVLAAEDINPNTVDSRIEVGRLTLQGFSSIVDYPLDISDIRGELNRLRSEYPTKVSVDELHQIADALTLYVRAKGFVFHTVYLPPQKMVGDEVYLELQEGVLTDIHVLNQTEIPDRRIKRIFRPLIGRLLYAPDVEERVKALKAQTGVKVFPFYSRGAAVGETRLNIRVDPDKNHHFSLKVDNYGSPTSGEYRALGQWTITQFTNRFDRLSLAVLAAVDDVPNYYGSIAYTRPTASLNYAWDISASNNQFELGDRFESLGLQGDAVILSTGLSFQRVHRAERRERWRLGYSDKSNRLDSDGVLLDKEDSQAFSLDLNKAFQWPELKFASLTHVSIALGDFQINDDIDDKFTKLELNSQWTKGLGSGGRAHSVLGLTFSLQDSDVNLPSIESFALTGPYGVRGFAPGMFSADSAFLVSGEWQMPNLLRVEGARWGLQPYAFIDWAKGEKLAIGANPASEAEFSGAGGGLRFYFGKHISGQIYGAGRIDGEIDGSAIYGEQLWRFELRLH